MNILETRTIDNQYFGLFKIDLRPYWDGLYANTAILNPNSYNEYKVMRMWLAETNTQHRFDWINSGVYLPDYLWLPDDAATFFKLKYGL